MNSKQAIYRLRKFAKENGLYLNNETTRYKSLRRLDLRGPVETEYFIGYVDYTPGSVDMAFDVQHLMDEFNTFKANTTEDPAKRQAVINYLKEGIDNRRDLPHGAASVAYFTDTNAEYVIRLRKELGL